MAVDKEYLKRRQRQMESQQGDPAIVDKDIALVDSLTQLVEHKRDTYEEWEVGTSHSLPVVLKSQENGYLFRITQTDNGDVMDGIALRVLDTPYIRGIFPYRLGTMRLPDLQNRDEVLEFFIEHGSRVIADTIGVLATAELSTESVYLMAERAYDRQTVLGKEFQTAITQ